ncbi:MAG: alkaline phosphatase, partial [bacterium]
MVSTTGFDTIGVSFASMRTSTGFSSNQFYYSIDSGLSWTDFRSYSPGTSFGLQSFDLSGIDGIANNPNAGFRIVFAGATGSTGNNRIDNLLVSGLPVQP